MPCFESWSFARSACPQALRKPPAASKLKDRSFSQQSCLLHYLKSYEFGLLSDIGMVLMLIYIMIERSFISWLVTSSFPELMSQRLCCTEGWIHVLAEHAPTSKNILDFVLPFSKPWRQSSATKVAPMTHGPVSYRFFPKRTTSDTQFDL